MIPDLHTHRCFGSAANAAGRRRLAFLPVILAVALSASCDKAPLTAPTGTTIRLTANTQVLPLDGTAEITASVIESGGYAVQNGTMVTFTTSLGTFTPTEVGTTNGKATVTFHAGSQAGTAVINAYSGANSTSGGTTTTPGTGVSIVVGAAAANTLVLTASPSSLSQLGGTSVIMATVYDVNNNPLPGVLVSFTTDQGLISPVSATTNASGQAQTTLSTTQTATVTASAGAKTGTAKVTTTALPTVSITGPSTTPTVGLTATFGLSVQPGSGSAPIRSVTVSFGDGSSVNLGAATGNGISVPHVYLTFGSYTATATAIDSTGQSTTASIPVVVFPAVPFTLTVNPSTVTATINITTVSFTATPNAGAPAVVSYTWDFGDSTQLATVTPFSSHLYTSVPNGQTSQQVTVTVTATGSDGRVGYGSCVITVTR